MRDAEPERAPAQKSAQRATADHGTTARDGMPAGNALGTSLNKSPRSQSLMQLRAELDESPRVQEQLALQRALDERATAAGKPKNGKLPLQRKGIAIIDDTEQSPPSARTLWSAPLRGTSLATNNSGAIQGKWYWSRNDKVPITSAKGDGSTLEKYVALYEQRADDKLLQPDKARLLNGFAEEDKKEAPRYLNEVLDEILDERDVKDVKEQEVGKVPLLPWFKEHFKDISITCNEFDFTLKNLLSDGTWISDEFRVKDTSASAHAILKLEIFRMRKNKDIYECQISNLHVTVRPAELAKKIKTAAATYSTRDQAKKRNEEISQVASFSLHQAPTKAGAAFKQGASSSDKPEIKTKSAEKTETTLAGMGVSDQQLGELAISDSHEIGELFPTLLISKLQAKFADVKLRG